MKTKLEQLRENLNEAQRLVEEAEQEAKQDDVRSCQVGDIVEYTGFDRGVRKAALIGCLGVVVRIPSSPRLGPMVAFPGRNDLSTRSSDNPAAYRSCTWENLKRPERTPR